MPIELVQGYHREVLASRLVFEFTETTLTVANFQQDPVLFTDNRTAKRPIRFEDNRERFTQPVAKNAFSGIVDRDDLAGQVRVTFADIDWNPDEQAHVDQLKETALPSEDDSDPYERPVFRAHGKITFNLDGLNGHDEIVPYSIIDLLFEHNGQPLGWMNRWIECARSKTPYAARMRSQKRAHQVASIYIPFVRSSLQDYHIHIVQQGQHAPLINWPVDVVTDERDLPEYGSMVWADAFWSVMPDTPEVQVASGDMIDLPFTLRWNKDGTLCEGEDLTLYASTDAGYLPVTKVPVVNGAGSVKFRALDLPAGTIANVKISARHFTNLGKFQITVT